MAFCLIQADVLVHGIVRRSASKSDRIQVLDREALIAHGGRRVTTLWCTAQRSCSSVALLDALVPRVAALVAS